MNLEYYSDILELKKGGMPPRNKKNFRSTKSGAGMTAAGVMQLTEEKILEVS